MTKRIGAAGLLSVAVLSWWLWTRPLHRSSDLATSGHAIAAPPLNTAMTFAPGDRMGAVDLLEAVAETRPTDDEAEQATTHLRSLASAPLPASANPEQKRVMVAEKYDALTALTRIDPASAVDLLQALPSPQRDALRGAVLGGLADRGVPRADLRTELARLEPFLR